MIYILLLIILAQFFYVLKLKGVFNAEKPKIEHLNESTDEQENYFKSHQKKIIFLLLEVDGERRNNLLGITNEMYEDKQLAKKWYKKISLLVHPDRMQNNNSDAFNELKELYLIMTDSGEVEGD